MTTMSTGGCRLAGRGVLVTRPAPQAEILCRLIREAGGAPVAFPTIEICPALDSQTPRALLAEHWDLLVFVSRNAVEHGLALLPPNGLPAGARLAAVGRATANALAAAGHPATLVPASGFDSEGLLALPELQQMNGKRVLIVRGDGGRTLLAQSLTARGALVRYAEVYRRMLPTVDATALLPAWRREVDLLTATSDEVLTNLMTLVGSAGRDWLLATPLVVISDRGASFAMQQGFRTVAVAEEASDEGVFEALCRLALVMPPPRR